MSEQTAPRTLTLRPGGVSGRRRTEHPVLPRSVPQERPRAALPGATADRPSVPPHRACAPQRPSGYNEHASAEALGTADQAPAFKHGLDDR